MVSVDFTVSRSQGALFPRDARAVSGMAVEGSRKERQDN
jgi:hypothetical protein